MAVGFAIGFCVPGCSLGTMVVAVAIALFGIQLKVVFRDDPGRVARAWLSFGDRFNPVLWRYYRAAMPYLWIFGAAMAVGCIGAMIRHGGITAGC